MWVLCIYENCEWVVEYPWNIASIVVTGRYMVAARGFADFAQDDDSEIEVDERNIFRAEIDIFDNADRGKAEFQESITAAFVELLENLCEGGAPITTLVIGSLGPIRSTDPGARKRGVRTFGEIADNQPYRFWSGLNFYNIANAFFSRVRRLNPDFPKETEVLVRTDATLRALGENRLRLRSRHTQYMSQSYKDDKREFVVAYLKLSREVSLGVSHHGTVWRGRLHPLIGMATVGRIEVDGIVDSFEGTCPNHEDCLEGLIGLEALEKRLGQSGALPDLGAASIDHPIWDLLAEYVARACLLITATFAPSVIVLGGRVTRDVLAEKKSHPRFLVSKVSRSFAGLISKSFVDSVDYLELTQSNGFIQGPVDDKSALYGGLVFASVKGRRIHTDPSRHLV